MLSLPVAPGFSQTNQPGKPTLPGTAAAQLPGKTPSQTGTPSPKQPAPRYVNCHALETHSNAQPAVTIVVFNQRDKPDHVRLSDLIKENDGGSVELRTSDGKWHKATLVRLRTCFGRGMLFMAGDAGEPKDRDNFLLRFPPKKIS
jgi:hypothetical protein